MEVRRLMARVFTTVILTHVSESLKSRQIISRIDMKTCHGTEGVNCGSMERWLDTVFLTLYYCHYCILVFN